MTEKEKPTATNAIPESKLGDPPEKLISIIKIDRLKLIDHLSGLVADRKQVPLNEPERLIENEDSIQITFRQIKELERRLSEMHSKIS
jgi:hypothetical protein